MEIDPREALEKAVWTDADFDQMGWHDATVHALAFAEGSTGEGAQDLFLDLDYIVRWIDPQPPSEYFTFLVAPATLVFQSVWMLEGDLAPQGVALEIDDVLRTEPEEERGRALGLTRWTIGGHDFDLRFLAGGFQQHFRARPIHVDRQRLTAEERGRFSFERPTAFADA